ncbi:MAG TPA: hypothetical protein VGK73_20355 [Polyangiaceae bacterium]
MTVFHKLAFRGSAIAALAFLTLAPACTEDSTADDDSNAGESGEGGTAGSTGGTGGKSGGSGGKASGGSAGSTAGSAGSSAGKAGNSSGGSSSGSGGTDAGGEGGNEPTGGTSPGGQGGSGAEGGEGEAGGNAAGAGGADDGPAIGKFCNDLTFGTEENPMPTTMILTVGEGDDKVSLTAVTGECAPAACIEIPTGTDVLVELFDADDPNTALDSNTTTIPAGSAGIFYNEVGEGGPVWQGFFLEENESCADFTYDDFIEG